MALSDVLHTLYIVHISFQEEPRWNEGYSIITLLHVYPLVNKKAEVIRIKSIQQSNIVKIILHYNNASLKYLLFPKHHRTCESKQKLLDACISSQDRKVSNLGAILCQELTRDSILLKQ